MSRPFGYRDADGDINLEEALGEHLRHYVTIMVSGVNGTRTQQLALGRTETEHGALLRQSFGLPTRASSCGTVAVQPGWSWDVCGYYVMLGVRWDASKGEIRRAYVAMCARPGTQVQPERLTYAVAQLSDPVIRRAYDLVPLGGVFTWDRDTEERIKRAAAAESAERIRQGEAVTADDVLEEMGVKPPPQDDDPGQEPARKRLPEARRSRWEARWGHYLLSGPQGPPQAVEGLLEAWQGMVAAALRERGIVMSFAVGHGHGGAPLVLQDVKEACIFIVTETEASPEKARAAVEMGINLGIVANNPGGI